MRITLEVSKRDSEGNLHKVIFTTNVSNEREHDFPTVKDLWEIERSINESTSGLRAHIDLTSE